MGLLDKLTGDSGSKNSGGHSSGGHSGGLGGLGGLGGSGGGLGGNHGGGHGGGHSGGGLGGSGGGLGGHSGGGGHAKKNDDMLDKGIDLFQEKVLKQGDQSNESAHEQQKDQKIADFVRSQYKSQTGKEFPIKEKHHK